MNTEIDGLKIYYRDEGEGPLLILLHGWGSNVDLFDGIFRFAADTVRVLWELKCSVHIWVRCHSVGLTVGL